MAPDEPYDDGSLSGDVDVLDLVTETIEPDTSGADDYSADSQP